MIKKISMNNYSKELHFNDVRNIIKKEIRKQAMLEVKQTKSFIQAKYAKQILFYYRFGSTNKRKRKNYMSLLSGQLIITLYVVENLPRKEISEDFQEGFRIL
jgi:hypothetical protein